MEEGGKMVAAAAAAMEVGYQQQLVWGEAESDETNRQ